MSTPHTKKLMSKCEWIPAQKCVTVYASVCSFNYWKWPWAVHLHINLSVALFDSPASHYSSLAVSHFPPPSPHLSFSLSLPLLHSVIHHPQLNMCFIYGRSKLNTYLSKLHVFLSVVQGLPWERAVQLALCTLSRPAAQNTPSPPSLHPAPAIESTGRVLTWGSVKMTTTR